MTSEDFPAINSREEIEEFRFAGRPPTHYVRPLFEGYPDDPRLVGRTSERKFRDEIFDRESFSIRFDGRGVVNFEMFVSRLFREQAKREDRLLAVQGIIEREPAWFFSYGQRYDLNLKVSAMRGM